MSSVPKLSSQHQKSKNKLADNSGVAVIEFALILPLLLLIVFGVIEFGLYFVKSEMVERTVSSVSTSLQLNPTGTDVGSIVSDTSNSLVNYSATGNYVCAQSYTTKEEAAAGCSAGIIVSTPPQGVATGTAYYVALLLHVETPPITGLFNFLPNIHKLTIIKVNNNAGGGGRTTLMGTVYQKRTAGVNFNGKDMAFNIPTSGNYEVAITANYYSCVDYSTDLYVDGVAVAHYDGRGYDTDGCDQNSLLATVVLAGGNHLAHITMNYSGKYFVEEASLLWIAFAK